MKKAQIEAMGLIIVVILVTIVLFISISLKKPAPETRAIEVYRDETMAGNFLVATLDMRVKACERVPGSIVTMGDLAKDCIRIAKSDPDDPSLGKYTCNLDEATDVTSCVVFEDIAKTLLEETLGQRGIIYNFDLSYTASGATAALVSIPGGCEENAPKSAPGKQLLTLPYDIPGSALLELAICNP